MADTDDEPDSGQGDGLGNGLGRTPGRPGRRSPGLAEDAPGAAFAGVDRRADEWTTGAPAGISPAGPDGTAADRAAEEFERATELERLGVEWLAEKDRDEWLADGARADRLEQDARAERELEESRYRDEVDHSAEHAAALRQALAANEVRDDLRVEAAGERRLARSDRSRATTLRAGAAGDADPAADADRAAANRSQVSANYQDRIANYDDARADAARAEAGDHRAEAARTPEQPPAVEAVRKPPAQAPAARKNRKPRRKKLLRDFGLGD
jgi:hypothetical protein